MPLPKKAGGTEGAEGGTSPPKAEVTFTAAQVQHGGVHWEPVIMGTVRATASVPGQLVPNADRTSRLGAPVGGRVLNVRVQLGQRVARGDVLVTLQSSEAGSAQSDVAKAQAQVTSRRAQATYAASARDRAERLLALKAIPRQDVERALADYELARAELLQSEAELRRARSTAEQMGVSSSTSGEVSLRSPLDGVVLDRTAVPGTVVEAGAPLVVVTDPSSLWIVIEAPEKLASLLNAGGRLRFTVPAYPADSFFARIAAVGAGLDPATRTLSVRGVVSNTERKLKPEMLATVVVEDSQSVAAAQVPEDAVQLLDGMPIVFVAKPDAQGGAQFIGKKVKLGSRSGGRVAILRGLSAGDVVVTQGAFAVKAQLKKGSMPAMEM